MINNHDLILFDLGGVLINPMGVPKMLAWTNGLISQEDLWKKWVGSPAVMALESGKISLETFADGVIDEFDLPVNRTEFISEFKNWAENLYPGVRNLLTRLSADYPLATLSNTNTLHWEWFKNQSGVYDHFTYHFPSHLTGLTKPNEETFYHVIEELPYESKNILFIDDFKENIVSAIQCGFKTACAKGFEDVLSIFPDYT
jgi:HAD superfamily hydrolase (TIGR01509 family)